MHIIQVMICTHWNDVHPLEWRTPLSSGGSEHTWATLLYQCLTAIIEAILIVPKHPLNPCPSKITWNTLATCPESKLVTGCPLLQSHMVTLRSSLPEANSSPSGEKLMQFTQPSCPSSRLSRVSRWTKDLRGYIRCVKA